MVSAPAKVLMVVKELISQPPLESIRVSEPEVKDPVNSYFRKVWKTFG
jgi:hypothetical protein